MYFQRKSTAFWETLLSVCFKWTWLAYFILAYKLKTEGNNESDSEDIYSSTVLEFWCTLTQVLTEAHCIQKKKKKTPYVVITRCGVFFLFIQWMQCTSISTYIFCLSIFYHNTRFIFYLNIIYNITCHAFCSVHVIILLDITPFYIFNYPIV